MRTVNINTATNTTTTSNANIISNIENYAQILQRYNLEYKQVDYYYQIGEIKKMQGWILHISVVISQVTEMLQTVIPILISENVSFKIAMNKQVCRALLNGHLGLPQLGKLLCIYPENDQLALSLSKRLISITQSYKGPYVPTDHHLGSVIFARYGSWNPILQKDVNGKERKYIYNISGQLIQDSYHIPFQLPEGVNWPFNEINSLTKPDHKNILNYYYKPIGVLKADVKGSVFKGIYVKGLFRTSSCVIKQGNKHMFSDEAGRDIYDRLVWQHHLHNEIMGTIPLPKIIDFFQHGGHTYLVLEFIKGSSFYNRIKQINVDNVCWRWLDTSKRIQLLDYILQLIEIIERLHRKGYVHRDIQPSNFLIDKNDNLVLIDIELTWSLHEKKPYPPFDLGTPGFMSPEQENICIPTFKEDIYGLGALIINALTFLSPTKFNPNNSELLKKSIYFFTGNKTIAEMLVKCTNDNPISRPDLRLIRTALETYQSEQLMHQYDAIPIIYSPKINYSQLKEVIEAALAGLANPPIVMSNDLWYSQNKNAEDIGSSHQKEYTRFPGLYEGIGGILYLLSRAKKMGFNIDSSMISYKKGWDYIKDYSNNNDLPISFYYGAAGIALTLYEGINSGLLENTKANMLLLKQYLDKPVKELDVATGIAGQGISILQCKKFLDNEFAQETLLRGMDILLKTQQKDGSWILPNITLSGKGMRPIGFANGIAGITWYLLQYITDYEDRNIEQAAVKALDWLNKNTNRLKDLFNRKAFKKIMKDTNETGDERSGIILLFIKAYETLQNTKYKQIAEEALSKYPSSVVIDNFTQDNGLAGLGEVYLEAARAFKNEDWANRAGWIAEVFTNTAFMRQKGMCYWQMNEGNPPTADLLTGNSGIIHFLLRYITPTQIGYRLLS